MFRVQTGPRKSTGPSDEPDNGRAWRSRLCLWNSHHLIISQHVLIVMLSSTLFAILAMIVVFTINTQDALSQIECRPETPQEMFLFGNNMALFKIIDMTPTAENETRRVGTVEILKSYMGPESGIFELESRTYNIFQHHNSSKALIEYYVESDGILHPYACGIHFIENADGSIPPSSGYSRYVEIDL